MSYENFLIRIFYTIVFVFEIYDLKKKEKIIVRHAKNFELSNCFVLFFFHNEELSSIIGNAILLIDIKLKKNKFCIVTRNDSIEK